MIQQAHTLSEAHHTLRTDPLEGNHPFYTDLSEARGPKALAGLRLRLMEGRTSAADHHALVGHRGSGKSTELLRLEEELKEDFFPVHLYLDPSLSNDTDYPELLLWLVESVAMTLHGEKINVSKALVNDVSKWFAETTKIESSSRKSTIGLETETEAGAAASFFGTGFKTLLRIKSAITGDSEFRKESRSAIKRRADQLIELVNLFLDSAQEAIGSRRILIVQDNLDRLDRDSALALFRDSSSLLKRLRGSYIWTAPVSTQLSPFNIANSFPNPAYMPMITVRNRDGNPVNKALAALRELLGKRLDLKKLINSTRTVNALISYSGGSVRDLLKLTDAARINALLDGRGHIQYSDVSGSALTYALGIQRSLFPHQTYFHILAEIHCDKNSLRHGAESPDQADLEACRTQFHELLSEGAVFAYNGDSLWYDVHPTLKALDDFKTACQNITTD